MIIRVLLFILIALSLIAGPACAKNDKSSKKNKSLPPGLHKKSEKGKPLPPGWEKKLSKGDILEASIYSRGRVVVPLGNDGVVSIEVEGKIFKLYKNTREIIDILN